MTLIELMISAAILTVVMSAVISSFLTTQRMLKDAMGLSELSLAAREIREKILFSATPYSSGARYAGLLSSTPSGGKPINSDGKITMEACTMGSTLANISSTPAQVQIELATTSDGKKRYLFNSKAATSTRWFWPIGTSVLNSSMSEIVSFDTAGAVNSSTYSAAQNAIRLNIDLTLTSDAKNPDGSPMIRRERIVVPIFGIIQPLKVASGGKVYW
ncbi:MAG: type II secretion system protein [Kiritimatiellae bacterium]|nr:type II secretion system protein [Kiritimatiellia bacterium]